MEWYEATPSRWQAEQDLTQRTLEKVESGIDDQGRAFLLGTVRILSRHGHEYAACKVRIVYPEGFPERGRVPAVYLESHRNWLKGPDAHIEEEWKLCLFVPGEAGIDFSSPDSLGELAPRSKIFFGHIARDYGNDCERYIRDTSGMTDADWARDLGSQIVEVSHIALAKHKRVRRAAICVFIALILWFVSFGFLFIMTP
jgi:hypothetical protein